MAKMIAFFSIIGLLMLSQNALAQQQDDAECLEKCLTDLQQRAPRLDASTVLSMGHIRVGNQTVMCPKYDSQMTNSTCGPYQEATVCLDRCPDGPVKSLSTSGFKPLQLVCIDRKEDFDQYMPCLSDNCASVQAQCQPKCGSFDDLSKGVIQMLRQVRGPSSPDQQPPNVRVESSNVSMIIDRACEGIACYAQCSRDPTTTKCGKDAYNLEMETIWTIFASLTQSVSSIGIATPWPESCRTLSASAATWTKSSVTGRPTVVDVTTDDGSGTTRSNSVDQFVQKARQPTITDGPLVTTTAKCEGAACGSSAERLASAFLIIFFVIISLLK